MIRSNVLLTQDLSCCRGLIRQLQAKCQLVIPATAEAWATVPRTDITVQREKVVRDALEEARRPAFDSCKLLNVCCYYSGYSAVSLCSLLLDLSEI